MLQAACLPSSVLLDASDIPRPNSATNGRQGKSLLRPVPNGHCSDDSPSSSFRLQRVPHTWSPLPADNSSEAGSGSAAQKQDLSSRAAPPALASASTQPPQMQGVASAGKPSRRLTARALPLSSQQAPGNAGPTAIRPSLARGSDLPAAEGAAQPAASDTLQSGEGRDRPTEAQLTADSAAEQVQEADVDCTAASAQSLDPALPSGDPASNGSHPAAGSKLTVRTQGHRVQLAAQLHATILGSSASQALLPEVDLLVQLLTLPLHCKPEASSSPAASPGKARQRILSGPADAAAFGAAALDLCGEICAS